VKSKAASTGPQAGFIWNAALWKIFPYFSLFPFWNRVAASALRSRRLLSPDASDAQS
jgi:hypothetical protein